MAWRRLPAAGEKLAAAQAGRRRIRVSAHRPPISGLKAIPTVRIYGITSRLITRAATVSIRSEGLTPEALAPAVGPERLLWNGNFTPFHQRAAGRRTEWRPVRIGLAHYNTPTRSIAAWPPSTGPDAFSPKIAAAGHAIPAAALFIGEAVVARSVTSLAGLAGGGVVDRPRGRFHAR